MEALSITVVVSCHSLLRSFNRALKRDFFPLPQTFSYVALEINFEILGSCEQLLYFLFEKESPALRGHSFLFLLGSQDTEVYLPKTLHHHLFVCFKSGPGEQFLSDLIYLIDLTDLF